MNTPSHSQMHSTRAHGTIGAVAIMAAALPRPPAAGSDAEWSLFLDIDGTLLDFAQDPEDVTVPAQLPDDLHRIHDRLQGAVALLSGRPLSQVDALLAWHTRAAAGLHGDELRTADAREFVTGDTTTLAQILQQAQALVAGVSGVRLEDKRRALALHYRGAPDAKAMTERIARALLQQAGARYTLQYGNEVIELKRAGVDKGRALDALMQQAPFRARRPWMLGDDLTDEDAFRAVNASGGVSVVVGPRRPTEARFALADPAAARAWLHALAAS